MVEDNNRAGFHFKFVLTDNSLSPGDVGHTTGV